MENQDNCKCVKICGDLSKVIIYPREYKASPGYLALGDWTQNPHIWLHYVESADGLISDDNVLLSTDTRYWDIHDVQRYFLGQEHCEQVLFTYQYPNLQLPSALGKHLWRINTSTKLPSPVYMKALHNDLELTLKEHNRHDRQIDKLIIPDQLVKLDRLNYFARKKFLYLLANALSLQNDLQLVSFENMQCKRLEGVRLIQQLACFNSKTLKYLFLWDFFLPNENPILINYRYITGSGKFIPRPPTRKCFIRSLAELRNLRVLALEYSHLADGTGRTLIALLPVLKQPHFRLQLMCRQSNIPGRTDAALGAGGHSIPDPAWRRVLIACPDLYLMMVFFWVRDYDNVGRFLMPSMSLREVHWQLGIDLKKQQRQHSDISCFIRILAFRYENTLTTLSIHQWRFVTFPLRAVFEKMPHLVRFFYIGYVEDDIDLRRMLKIVSCGVCDKLKQVKIQVQDTEIKRCYWRDVVEALTKEYSDIMQLYGIDLCLSVYKT